MQYTSNTSRETSHHEGLISARLKMQGDSAHHLEVICEKNGVTWINHSMATTIEMTWFALRDIPGPVLLMIGGVDREDDHEKLNQFVREKVHTVICMGSTPWKYFDAWRDAAHLIVHANDLNEAIDFAVMLSQDAVKTVLFSPSCPSYDAFDNYKNRGNAFRRSVNERLQFNNQ